MTKRILKAIAITAFALKLSIVGAEASAETQLQVVTSLSTFADLAQQVGGDGVSVSYIANPRFNPHFIEPKPTDVLKVKRADLFVHAGLDLEAWRGPLLTAAGNARVMWGSDGNLDLSQGIKLLNIPSGKLSRTEGDLHVYGNPHYWLDPRNGIIMAKSIAEKLISLNPGAQEEYEKGLRDFIKSMNDEIFILASKISPLKGKEVIGYHDSWAYLMNYTGMSIHKFIEPKPGIQPTPKYLESLIDYIQNNSVGLIIQEGFYSKSAAEKLARETGASVSLLCQNVGQSEECSSYQKMVAFNVESLIEGLN